MGHLGLKKLLALITFSLLLLVPVWAQNTFADHTLPYTGTTGHCDLTSNPPGPAVIYNQCDLSSADFTGIDMNNARLNEANLVGTEFGCPLNCANLAVVRLLDARLAGANLAGADLSSAITFRTDFSNANLTGADLSHADLSRADFSGADLSNADLSSADLDFADLSFADFSNANLASAVITSTTTFQSLLCGEGTKMNGNECVPDFASICGEGTQQENFQCVITKVTRLGWDIVRKFLGFN